MGGGPGLGLHNIGYAQSIRLDKPKHTELLAPGPHPARAVTGGPQVRRVLRTTLSEKPSSEIQEALLKTNQFAAGHPKLAARDRLPSVKARCPSESSVPTCYPRVAGKPVRGDFYHIH